VPEISVVILTRNRKDDLVEAIESVLTQTGVSFEVILVDNASTDGTPELIEQNYPQIRYLRLPYNLGVIGGRNIGMANARGEIVFLLDDDAILPRPDIMEKACQHFQNDPALGVLFGTIHNYFNGQIERPVGIQSPDYSWSKPYYTYEFRGVAEFIRGTLLEEIGYLEPLFFREGEERDFSLRALAVGKRILYTPSVEVRHKINPHRYSSPEVQSLKFLHELITLWTYYPAIDALFFSAWDIASGFLYSMKGRWFINYARGLFVFLFWYFPFTISRRRRPLPKEIIHHVYALGAQTVSNPDQLLGARISLSSYCWNYLRYLFRRKREGCS
jgi:hypothetical protein